MNLRSVGNVLDTSELEKFAYGGRSSSALLNRLMDATKGDLESLANNAESIKEAVAVMLALATAQATAIGASVASLTTKIDDLKTQMATQVVRTVRLDMFIPSLITEGEQATTANINRKFGQATLPIVGETDWLVKKDLDNNLWVPDATKLYYATSDTQAVYEKSENSMIQAVEATSAFDKNIGTMWAQDVDGQLYASVFVKAPVEMLVGGYANTLEICPFPLMAHDLLDVTLVAQDGRQQKLTIWPSTPGYVTESGDPIVNNFGNIRFFFPPTMVYGVKLLIRIAADQSYWGFTDIALKTTKFDTTGRLSFNINQYSTANKPTFCNIAAELVGNDPNYLSTLTKTISDTCVQVDLEQQASGMTPVVTAADVTWTAAAEAEAITTIFR